MTGDDGRVRLRRCACGQTFYGKSAECGSCRGRRAYRVSKASDQSAWLTCRVCGRTKAPGTFPIDRSNPAARLPVCFACGGARARAQKAVGR